MSQFSSARRNFLKQMGLPTSMDPIQQAKEIRRNMRKQALKLAENKWFKTLFGWIPGYNVMKKLL